MKKFTILGIIFLLTLIQIQMAFAWGPITHMALNYEAAKSAGQLAPNVNFVMGGHSPDMISFWHVLTSKTPLMSTDKAKYDYGHNLISASDGYTILDVDESNNEFGIPMFGKKMLKAYKL